MATRRRSASQGRSNRKRPDLEYSEIRSNLEAEVQKMVDESAAQGWSQLDDQTMIDLGERVSKTDLEDFRGFCRNATDSQLEHIYEKERSAGRRGYANVAKQEMERRGLRETPRAHHRPARSVNEDGGESIEWRWAQTADHSQGQWQRGRGRTEREVADHIASLVGSQCPVPGAYRPGRGAKVAGPHRWRMSTGGAIETRTVKGAMREAGRVRALGGDEFATAYIEAALWSTNDNADEQGGEPLDANYSIEDIDAETLDAMHADCADFQKKYASLLTDSGLDDGQAGHDFWLSRNGHGAGFFDRTTEGVPKQIANALQKAARSYGEFDLYVGDDGKIHGSPLRRYTPPSTSEHRMRAPESYSEGRPTQRFQVGSRVVLSPDALENYGARWRDQVLVVTHVSTAYMPSNQFYSRGQPKGYHPGYDPESGGALYDFKVEGTGQEGTMSVYDWELESAPAKAPQRRSARSTRRR